MPDADADVVYAAVGENFKNILSLPFFVPECHTGIFKGNDGGDIHSPNKIGIVELYFFGLYTVLIRSGFFCRRARNIGADNKQQSCRKGKNSVSQFHFKTSFPVFCTIIAHLMRLENRYLKFTP